MLLPYHPSHFQPHNSLQCHVVPLLTIPPHPLLHQAIDAPAPGSQPASSQLGPGAPPPTRQIAPPPFAPSANPYAASTGTNESTPAVATLTGPPPRATSISSAASIPPPPTGRSRVPLTGEQQQQTSRPSSATSLPSKGNPPPQK